MTPIVVAVFRLLRALLLALPSRSAQALPFLLGGLTIGALLVVRPAMSQVDEPGGTPEAARMAIQDPDEYAWQLFLYINRQAKEGEAGVADPTKADVTQYDPGKDVVWETWALASSDGTAAAEVFLPGGATPPTWDQLKRGAVTPKILDHTFTAIASANVHRPKGLAFPPNQPANDEVRMNRATFDFVLAHNLYNREGLTTAFSEANQARQPDYIQFPTFAKEVKAVWHAIGPEQQNRYHWKQIGNQLYGLVAFHVITKDAPMWFWTDFLHEDFVAGEVVGSFHDSTTLGNSATHGRDGIRDETRGSKWQYYRLKGTQLNFFNARGEETILGNQLIESNNAAISSCVTCHASAGIDASGLPRVAGFVLGAPPATNFTINGQMQRLQTDFLYSIPLRAHSKSESTPKTAKAAPVARQTTQPIVPRIMEAYPERVLTKLRSYREDLAKGLPSHGLPTLQYIILKTQRWSVGQTVTVAFKGGNPTLHKEIADATKNWTGHANLKLDFGLDAKTGSYRQWSVTETAFGADIRISFDQRGYYSLVGTDSNNLAVVGTGEESMNLQGFDVRLPQDWRTVVLHEFGHALGFEHEHQYPDGGCDFRWQDDPGYLATQDVFGQFMQDISGRRPGIYTLLGGPPNHWSQKMVDDNLRKLPASSAFMTSAFDPKSIMKYYFESYMFVDGDKSRCYSDGENLILSALDISGVERAYPTLPSDMQMISERRGEAIEALKRIENLGPKTRSHLDELK
jgi:hypothetical protein